MPAFYMEAKARGVESVLKEYQHLLHQFVTNNNISERAITDSSKCPEFHDLMEYVFQNASHLKGHETAE